MLQSYSNWQHTFVWIGIEVVEQNHDVIFTSLTQTNTWVRQSVHLPKPCLRVYSDFYDEMRRNTGLRVAFVL
jgi:hypothetical protein